MPQAIGVLGAEIGVVRNAPLINYRVVSVKHCTHLPVLTEDCSRRVVLSQVCSQGQRRPNNNVQPLRRYPTRSHYPLGRAGFRRYCRLTGAYFSTLTPTRLVASPEKFGHSFSLPISLWVTIRQSLGKPRQRAHRRRFARPPRF
jgi:hypothetical protein